MKQQKGLYTVFSGNICTGKDTTMDLLRKSTVIREAYPGVHFLKEAVNHDPDVLGAYYSDQLRAAEFFELGTLCFRAVLGVGMPNTDLVIGNRHVIEARRTFVEYARGMRDGEKRPFDETATGIYDMLLRRGVESGAIKIPNLVFFLHVNDSEILIERNRGRASPGEEELDPNYLIDLDKLFNDYRTNFSSVYTQLGVEPPKLVEIDVSHDIKEDKRRIDEIVALCERELVSLRRS